MSEKQKETLISTTTNTSKSTLYYTSFHSLESSFLYRLSLGLSSSRPQLSIHPVVIQNFQVPTNLFEDPLQSLWVFTLLTKIVTIYMFDSACLGNGFLCVTQTLASNSPRILCEGSNTLKKLQLQLPFLSNIYVKKVGEFKCRNG